MEIGGLLDGIATCRARVFRRPAAILIFGGVIVGSVLSVLNNPIILMLAGFAWCGLSLWVNRRSKSPAGALDGYDPLDG